MLRAHFKVGRIVKILWSLLLFLGVSSQAAEKAQVLPRQVNYLSLRYGLMNHLSQTYGSNGNLSFRGDALSQNFDLPKIKKFATEETAKELDRLVRTINTFGGSKIADQLSLGTLSFDVNPEIRYTAPVYARGITDRFTLGFAVPVINYKVDVGMKQVGSNIPSIRQEMAAIAENSEELQKGLDRLDESLVSVFQRVTSERGYKALRSRDDSFVGDVQVVGLYQLVKGSKENLVAKLGLVLPTGPEDDADDLTDLNNQHQTAVGVGLINDYNLASNWAIGVGSYYLSRLPDKSTKRVPENEGDVLPDQDRKETLYRDLGDSLTVNGNLRHQLNRYFEVALGVEAGVKGSDRYTGANNWDYSLLARNTYQNWRKSMLTVEYSTVEGFLAGQNSIPYSLSYDFSDIFAGTNIDRQQVHEVGLKMYF